MNNIGVRLQQTYSVFFEASSIVVILTQESSSLIKANTHEKTILQLLDLTFDRKVKLDYSS